MLRALGFSKRLAIAGKSGINSNLISRTNKLSSAESLEFSESRANGVPRLDRQDVNRIVMLHDTTQVSASSPGSGEGGDLFIAGRNKCNGFGNNQYLVGSKKSKEAMLVGASDDWPDDWIHFCEEMGGIRITQCFLSHCHVDDMINLPLFWQMLPDLRVHWPFADEVWLDAFKNSCIRYNRPEMANATLPMAAQHFGCSNPLSSLTNRTSSFLMVGAHVPCYYISTPGHSPGHMLLHLPLHRILFTGDLLFRDSIGRVDIPYGCGDQMGQSLRAIEEMPDATVIMPSHGRISTLGRERRMNPALRRLYELLASGKQMPKVGTNSGFF